MGNIQRPTLGSISGKWKHFINDEKCFLFYLERSFFLKYLNFCPEISGRVEERLDKKVKVFSNKVVAWETNDHKTHIPNTSRSQGNQTMKFDPLVEYNRRNRTNIFLEKSYTKCGGEASPRPISKKSKLSIYLDQQFEILLSLLLFYVRVEDYQYWKVHVLVKENDQK